MIYFLFMIDMLRMHRSIGEKLEVCSKGPVEWNSPVGLLEFRKSALQTDYEKAENKFVNEVNLTNFTREN